MAAIPTTLKELAEQRRTRAADDHADATNQLGLAQSQLAAAKAEHAARASALADIGEKSRQKRRAMADAPMPADVHALEAELEDLLIKSRAAAREVQVADVNRDGAERELAGCTARVGVTTTRLASAEAGFQQAEAREKTHVGWLAQVATAPLNTLPDDAEALLADARLAAAKQWIEAELPAALLVRARARGAAARDRLARETELLASFQAFVDDPSQTPDEATLGDLWTDFLRKEERLREYVLRGADEYARAIEVLQAIPTLAAMTSAQKERVHAASLLAARTAAAALEKTRDDKRVALDSAQDNVDKETMAARARDCDLSPPASAELTAAVTLREKKNDEWENADVNLDAPNRRVLDQWEVQVPDYIWQALVDLERAVWILTKLKNTDPADLAVAMRDAERVLVAALTAEDKRLRTVEVLQAETERRRGRLRYLRETLEPRVLSATRGDL